MRQALTERRPSARSARLSLGSAVAAAAAFAMAATAIPASAADEERPVLLPFICTHDGVCIAYVAALADKDGDGVPDIDEDAAGTDAADAWSAPTVDTITGLIGEGMLPSFELGFAQVVVLPETFPDGRPFVRDITAAAAAGRGTALARMGIADGLLDAYGLDLGAGIVLDRAAAAVGMKLDDGGRPVRDEKSPPVQKRVGGVVLGWIGADDGGVQGEKGDGAPVDMSPVPGAMGTDRNGGKDFWGNMWDGVKDMFGGGKKPDSTDGGTPKTLTTGDEGNAVLPVTAEDLEKIAVKLGAATKPVSGNPKVTPDITGVDLNPRRTIILTDDPVDSKVPADLLKILVVAPDPSNPADRNTNFGPNGGILPGVVPGSGWPKP